MTGIKVFLYGLDQAGKTAISDTIKLGKTVDMTRPTLAIIMNQTIIKNLAFFIWDMPGQIALRKSWKDGLFRSKLLIFVLNTANKERFEEAKEVFLEIINNPETEGLPLIFCFHKMDLQEAKDNLQEAKNEFQLNSIAERKVFVQETSIKEMDTIEKLKEVMSSNLLG